MTPWRYNNENISKNSCPPGTYIPLEKQEAGRKINTLTQYRMSDAATATEDMKQGKMIEASGARTRFPWSICRDLNGVGISQRQSLF